MAQETKRLWDAAQAAESLWFGVDSVQTALDTWYEDVEKEIPSGTDPETLACVNFANRFPAYLCILRCIQTELATQVKKLLQLSDDLYDAARKEKEEKRREEKKGGAPDAES